jgi:hypothetical protein
VTETTLSRAPVSLPPLLLLLLILPLLISTERRFGRKAVYMASVSRWEMRIVAASRWRLSATSGKARGRSATALPMLVLPPLLPNKVNV